MANEDNLIPLSERTKDEQRKIQRKGGKASGRARRRKANLKKTMEQILSLDLPDSGMKEELIKRGLDPSMEQGLVLSVVMSAITHGDHQALRTIQNILEQTSTLADRREQKARTERLQAETERIKEESNRKSGRTGQEQAEAQTKAIADMINNPQSERVLSDFLGGGKNEGEPNSDAAADSVQSAE